YQRRTYYASVATDVSHVATHDSSVATCDTNVAIDKSCATTCATNVTTDELYVVTCVTNVATDESCVATCDTNVVVDSWITPTEEELQMSYLITLGLVETIFDPVVDRVKMVLAGATTIKRDRVPNEVVNELVVFYGAVVGAGVCVVAGAGADAGQHKGNTFCR
ncbi:hypothetical protein EJD97_005822, partial [Solanum chilense]